VKAPAGWATCRTRRRDGGVRSRSIASIAAIAAARVRAVTRPSVPMKNITGTPLAFHYRVEQLDGLTESLLAELPENRRWKPENVEENLCSDREHGLAGWISSHHCCPRRLRTPRPSEKQVFGRASDVISVKVRMMPPRHVCEEWLAHPGRG